MTVVDDVVDLSMPFYEGMPTDDLGPKVWERMSYAYAKKLQGHTQTRLGRLILTTDHTGTHIDGPLRFDPAGPGLETLPLERFVAPARVLDLRSAKPHAIGVDELKAAGASRLLQGEAAVLWTAHDERIAQPDYFTKRPSLSIEGAAFLASMKVSIVAADFPGIGAPDDERYEVKRTLHRAGVLTVEQLRNLSAVADRQWHLFAGPLRIRNAAGSLLRACALVGWRATELVDLSLVQHGKMPSLGAVPTFWNRARHDLTGFFTGGEYSYQSQAMMLNEHAGTHLDAPCHFDEFGRSIEQLRLPDLVCKARMLDLRHKGANDPISAADLQEALQGRPFKPGDAAVVWTDHSKNYDREDYGHARPFITADGADWIVKQQPSLLVTDLIGLDEDADHTSPVHNRILLSGLCMLQVTTRLAELAQGDWMICAFPIAIVGGTGAPLRAFAARM